MKFLHDFAYKTQEDQSQSQVCVGPFLTSVKKKKKQTKIYLRTEKTQWFWAESWVEIKELINKSVLSHTGSSIQVCPHSRNLQHSHIQLFKSLFSINSKGCVPIHWSSQLSLSLFSCCRHPVSVLFNLTARVLWRLSPRATTAVSSGL